MEDGTSELIRSVIGQEIDRWFSEQGDWLKENILSGCDETDSYENIYSRMVLNSIATSVKLAADIAITFLIKAGVSEPKSEEELRRLLMLVVK